MDLGRLIEKKLQEAREAGAFDALPSKGLIDLDDAGVPEDERLAMHLLKSNGWNVKGQMCSNRSTFSTNTVAPPTSTSIT